MKNNTSKKIAGILLSVCILASSCFNLMGYASVVSYDLTETTGGGGLTLPCIWVKETSDTQHWERCLNHNDKRSVASHSLTYSGGDGTCNSATVRIALCSICGWSKAGNNPHINTAMSPVQRPSELRHSIGKCATCGRGDTNVVRCTDSQGNLITCTNRKTCVVCGYNYSNYNHPLQLSNPTNSINTATRKVYTVACGICNTSFGTIDTQINSKTDKKTVYTTSVTVPSSMNITSAMGTHWSYAVGSSVANGSASISGKTATVQYSFIYDGQVNSYAQGVAVYVTINGLTQRISTGFSAQDDVTAPTINAPTISPAIGSTFVQQRTITFSAVDTYSDLVYLGIAEQANGSNMVVPLGVGVKSGTTFTRSSVPLTLEAGTTAKTFYIIAKDKIGNQSSRAFTISHTDMQAPSAPTVTGLEPNIWRQSKNVRVSTVDAGVGGVQIAFNGVADYKAATQSGTTFTRDLIFTGTVVTPQTRVFYLKDSLGNAREYSFQIGWLDNKAPTTPSYKTKLGVGDGKHAEEWPLNVEWISGTDAESGVSHVEYSYDNLQWVTGTVQKVEKTQTVYARTVDKVGNTSAVRAVAVLIDANRPEVGYG